MVAAAHGLDESDILDGGNVKEVKRARHQFRYLTTRHMGVREGARLLGCAPATILYSRHCHDRMMKEDFLYQETYNNIIEQL